MSQIAKGLCWAGSLIILALGNRLGLVDDKIANTLFVILPIMAATTLRSDTRCQLRGRSA
jgi:hypothetical protein